MTDCVRSTMKTGNFGASKRPQNGPARVSASDSRPPGVRRAHGAANEGLMMVWRGVSKEFRIRTMDGLESGSVFTWVEAIKP